MSLRKQVLLYLSSYKNNVFNTPAPLPTYSNFDTHMQYTELCDLPTIYTQTPTNITSLIFYWNRPKILNAMTSA